MTPTGIVSSGWSSSMVSNEKLSSAGPMGQDGMAEGFVERWRLEGKEESPALSTSSVFIP